MSVPHLRVRDVLLDDVVQVARSPFTIGRRETNHLRLGNAEVSRDHADIVLANGRAHLRDHASKYGTFVNGEPITECELHAGDEIRLGRTGGAVLVYLDDGDTLSLTPGASSPRDGLRQVTGLLHQLRSLGTGRVLQQVLTLILDTALEVSRAERGFIMLATPAGALEFRLGRSRQKETLSDLTFATSHAVPEEVFRTGKAQSHTDIRLDGKHDRTAQFGIRSVVCVPLKAVRYVDAGEAAGEDRRLGVLYLDSNAASARFTTETLATLEAVADEASRAIEQARLFREQAEKIRLEQEMRFAADMQKALLPQPEARRAHLEGIAAMLPCRAIGGDFYDYLGAVPSEQGLAFTLGDVAGKGAPAALMSALLLGMVQAESRLADSLRPAAVVSRLNAALCERDLDSRFVTLVLGAIAEDGTFTYCNAGHNPPMIFRGGDVIRLEAGGPLVGLLSAATWRDAVVQLVPGDVLIVYSDGATEARNAEGDEFGEARLAAAIGEPGAPPQTILDRVLAAIRLFTAGTPQGDDLTVMVFRYLGRPASGHPVIGTTECL